MFTNSQNKYYFRKKVLLQSAPFIRAMVHNLWTGQDKITDFMTFRKNDAQRTYYTLRNFTTCSLTTTLCLNFGEVIFVFGWGHLHSEYLTIFYLASQSICVKWNGLLFLIMLFGLFIFTKDVASYLRFGRFSSPVLILNLSLWKWCSGTTWLQ